MVCPLDLTESEQCGAQVCTAPGLACSEYSACTDCTDNGKTSPRRCQFCGSADGVGVCQSLNMVDGDDSSGLRACANNFDQRATTIAQCSTDVHMTAQATMTSEVIEMVDERSALNLDTGDTVAIAAPSTDIALIAGVAGAIVALLIIAIIVTVVVCMSRRRRTKNAPQSTPPQVAATAMDEFVSAREPASTAVRTHTYGNLPTLYVDSARALSNPPTAHSQYNALDPTEI
jgi:hypothetical protein